MRPFDRLFGKDRRARAAQRAELGGELARAAELWLEAERPDEAARVLIARSETELEAKLRLALLGQAIDLAPEGSTYIAVARKKRAALRLELAKTGALGAAMRHDLREAAVDLEALGDPVAAAEAFRLLGDREGRARALVAAGAVEELEEVLHDDVSIERSSRDLREGASSIETLLESGERRAALLACESLAERHRGDAGVREKLDVLRSSRLVAPIVDVAAFGKPPITWVLGDEVRVGRTEGQILVPQAAVSRVHVRIFRDATGLPHVEDAGSRNGTTLRGVKLGGALPIPSATEIELGGEVPMRLVPEDGRVRIEVAGRVLVAPLGPAHLGIAGWKLLVEADQWIALDTGGTTAFMGAIAMGKLTQLLAGDSFSTERGGPTVLFVQR